MPPPPTPAKPAPDRPTAADPLKPPIEHALAIERGRWRRDTIRRELCFLLLLAAILGGGLWLARRLILQADAERHSARLALQQCLAQLAALSTPAPAPSRPIPDPAPVPAPPPVPVPVPEPAPPATRAPTPDIQELIAVLEAQNRTLVHRLDTQQAETRRPLASREAELRALQARLDEVQRRAPQNAPPPPAPAPASAATRGSVMLTTSNAIPLRLPIPPP